MTGETMVPANGVDLCVETFGEPSDPPLLLIAGGGSSMDWWDDEFCRRLAAGGRYVIRYDHRDTGRSTAFPPGAPPYSQADLADDVLGLLDALGERQAHLVGISLGGELAQRIAVDHPSRPLSLTLISTSPGPRDAAPAPALGPDLLLGWSDRKTAVDRLIAETREAGGPFTVDEPQLRRLAERVFDRTTDMPASRANHRLLAAGPPIRERLGTITVPTLVLHGTLDPLVAMDHAEALVREIPGARLVELEGVGHEYPPPAVWNQVIGEILKHTA
jgi:pimeloyl-ACP methyl ester carboxylesterase